MFLCDLASNSTADFLSRHRLSDYPRFRTSACDTIRHFGWTAESFEQKRHAIDGQSKQHYRKNGTALSK